MKLFLLFLTVFAMACASVNPPDGGPTDSTPPVVIASYPDSAATNVSPRYFSFTFDEFVKTKEIQDLLIISPTLASKPRTEIKKKTLFIRFDDTLKTNTTYSISLSGCIVDNNEGNVLANHRLAFSTGPKLDSLNYSAFVSESYSKEACANCLLLLYDQDQDSGALLYRPTYLAQTNAAGYATISNLAQGRYWAQALKDDNKNLLLNNEELSSLKREVYVTDSMRLDSFSVFPYLSKKESKATFKQSSPGVGLILFDPPLRQNDLKVYIDSIVLEYRFSLNKDTAFIYYPLRAGDSINIQLAWDTISASFPIKTEELNKHFRLKYSIANNRLVLQSKQKIKAYDLDRITLTEDSATIKIKSAELSQTSLILLLQKAPLKKIHLSLEDSALINLNGQSNRKDSSVLDAYNPESSTLTLDLQLSQDGQYLVQLIKRDKIVEQSILRSSQKKVYKNLGVGNYRFRIIRDDNANEIWDTGDYLLQTPPESLLLSTGIDLRPNWDKELIIKF